MKRADLFREFARVIDLCEGTPVKPLDCVKIDGNKCCLDKIFFIDSPDQYTFALAIVEDKPVFAGDVLYHKDGHQYTVQEVEKHKNGRLAFRTVAKPWIDGDWIENYTWTPINPFAGLLKAQAEGKRIVFNDGAKWVDIDIIDTVNFKPASYRVAKEDKNNLLTLFNIFEGVGVAKVNFKKCGITGKLTAEVLE